jgi:hypothetical protein
VEKPPHPPGPLLLKEKGEEVIIKVLPKLTSAIHELLFEPQNLNSLVDGV